MNPTLTKDEIKRALSMCIGNVTFTKKDGTERKMRCTLIESYLPQVDPAAVVSKRPENPDVLAVWDLDNSGWRSFRVDSVSSVAIE